MTDFDSPWKEVLDWYFEAFVLFFFPEAHADIDWSRGYEFLDKELQQIMKEAELGRRVVDKLAKVWLKSGEEEWILIHIEVQTQVEVDFPQRIFVYSYRLFDRYNRKVVSFAVLADDRQDWRPREFGYAMWGFEIGVRFPIVKLLDFADRVEELVKQPNPFGVVVAAHLKALETRRDPHDRRASKLALVKHLYEHGWSGDDIRKLFRFIDWIMDLPKELEQSFWHDYCEFEEEKHMPYITSVERIGMEKGMEKGLEKGMEKGMEKGRIETLMEAIALDVDIKFPDQAADIMKLVQTLASVDALRSALKAVKTAATAEAFRNVLASLGRQDA